MQNVILTCFTRLIYVQHDFAYTLTRPHNYTPQQYLREGNVFTGICQSFCPQGGWVGITGLMSFQGVSNLWSQVPSGVVSMCRGVGTHPIGHGTMEWVLTSSDMGQGGWVLTPSPIPLPLLLIPNGSHYIYARHACGTYPIGILFC